MEDVAKFFLSQGVLGAALLVVGILYLRRDKDFIKEKDSRIEDAKALLAMHKPVLDALAVVHDLQEAIEKRERDREIADRALHQQQEYGPVRRGSRPDMETPLPVPPRRGPR